MTVRHCTLWKGGECKFPSISSSVFLLTRLLALPFRKSTASRRQSIIHMDEQAVNIKGTKNPLHTFSANHTSAIQQQQKTGDAHILTLLSKAHVSRHPCATTLLPRLARDITTGYVKREVPSICSKGSSIACRRSLAELTPTRC